MRLFICLSLVLGSLSVVATASSSSSTSSATVPTCGLQCIQSVALGSVCGFNVTCICMNIQVQDEIKACVASNCTIREALESEKYANDTCGIVGEDRTGLLFRMSVAFFAVAAAAFGLRCLERIRSGMWGPDDHVLAVVTVMMVPITIIMVLLSQAGLGLDAWNVSGDNIERVLYLFYFEEILYPWGLALIKISILLFYLRVFPKRTIRIVVYVLIALNFCYALSFGIVLIFQCNPVSGAWKSWDGQHPSTCLNTNLAGWSAAAINIVLDIATLAVPLHDVSQLRMGLRKKIQVMCMFTVGFFVTLISILRLKSLIEFGSTKNPTQDYVEAGWWSMIELCTGILCASMPAIRALLAQALPAVFGSQIYGSGQASRTTNRDRYGTSRADKTFQPQNSGTDDESCSTYGSSQDIVVKNEWVVMENLHDNRSDLELVTFESMLPPSKDPGCIVSNRPLHDDAERWSTGISGSR